MLVLPHSADKVPHLVSSLAGRGGCGRAAESRHRSQPAISRRAEKLAQQLGSVLFGSFSAQKRRVEAGFGMALLIESSVQEEPRLGSLEIIDAPALGGGVPVTLVRGRNG